VAPGDLKALLRTLRRYGVLEYVTPELTIKLGGAATVRTKEPARPGELAMDPDVPFELPELGEDDDDPRTVLADLVRKNHPNPAALRPPRTVGPGTE
jgi:hypothetical protein